MRVSIDLDKFDNQLNILQDELQEVDYMLKLLENMRLEDQMNGNAKQKFINDQIHTISKQREYILNRKAFLLETAETFSYTKHQVANSLEDALNCLR